MSLLEITNLEFFDLGNVYPTCLAIAGVLFMIADYFNFQYNMLKYLKRLESKQASIVKLLKKEGLNVSQFEHSPRSFDLFPIKGAPTTWLEKYHNQITALINLTAIISIIVLPQLEVVNFIFNNAHLTESINNFAVFFGIGISIYLFEKKSEYREFEDEMNDIFDELFIELYNFKDFTDSIDLPLEEKRSKLREISTKSQQEE